jgi:hypothetical protein
MRDKPPPEELRATFQNLLNLALTRGRRASSYAGLRPSTRAAINVVAHEHPYAEAELIAAAYDAFGREHVQTAAEPIAENTSYWR